MGDRYNTPWRNFATALYAPPSEGKVSGSLDLDVTEALRFIKRQSSAGAQLTITHLMTAAIGRTLAEEVPELNCFIRRGKIVPRPHVDISLTAASTGQGGLALICVRDANRKSLAEIADQIRADAEGHRAGRDSQINRSKFLLNRVPWPFRRLVIRALSWLIGEFGLQIRRLGLSDQAFGSILLSNIGVFGLTTGIPALFPVSRLPGVVAIGKIEERAVVRDGEIVIRSILPVTATFDHRLTDAEPVGRLAAGVARLLDKPKLLMDGNDLADRPHKGPA
jgi:pyruvate dehydrogenase E2 component (dihydrolipoamide acetyltransferase)